MATTYDEIRTKYAEAVRVRRVNISNAQNKVERLTAMIEYYTDEREQYRQGKARISAENATMWNSLTRTINRLNDLLNAAKMGISEAQIGKHGMETIKKELNL